MTAMIGFLELMLTPFVRVGVFGTVFWMLLDAARKVLGDRIVRLASADATC